MSNSIFWEPTCDWLVFRPREVKNFYPLNTTETMISTGPNELLGLEKDSDDVQSDDDSNSFASNGCAS